MAYPSYSRPSGGTPLVRQLQQLNNSYNYEPQNQPQQPQQGGYGYDGYTQAGYSAPPQAGQQQPGYGYPQYSNPNDPYAQNHQYHQQQNHQYYPQQQQPGYPSQYQQQQPSPTSPPPQVTSAAYGYNPVATAPHQTHTQPYYDNYQQHQHQQPASYPDFQPQAGYQPQQQQQGYDYSAYYQQHGDSPQSSSHGHGYQLPNTPPNHHQQPYPQSQPQPPPPPQSQQPPHSQTTSNNPPPPPPKPSAGKPAPKPKPPSRTDSVSSQQSVSNFSPRWKQPQSSSSSSKTSGTGTGGTARDSISSATTAFSTSTSGTTDPGSFGSSSAKDTDTVGSVSSLASSFGGSVKRYQPKVGWGGTTDFAPKGRKSVPVATGQARVGSLSGKGGSEGGRDSMSSLPDRDATIPEEEQQLDQQTSAHRNSGPPPPAKPKPQKFQAQPSLQEEPPEPEPSRPQPRSPTQPTAKPQSREPSRPVRVFQEASAAHIGGGDGPKTDKEVEALRRQMERTKWELDARVGQQEYQQPPQPQPQPQPQPPPPPPKPPAIVEPDPPTAPSISISEDNDDYADENYAGIPSISVRGRGGNKGNNSNIPPSISIEPDSLPEDSSALPSTSFSVSVAPPSPKPNESHAESYFDDPIPSTAPTKKEPPAPPQKPSHPYGYVPSIVPRSRFASNHEKDGTGNDVAPEDIGCAECGVPIVGRMVSALRGRKFHPECFKCICCGTNLEHIAFFEGPGDINGTMQDVEEGKSIGGWCGVDWDEHFSLKCYHCKTAIVDESYITISEPSLGPPRTYHELHFFCASCGDPFIDPKSLLEKSRISAIPGVREESGKGKKPVEAKPFVVRKGHPYCEKCDIRLFRTKCWGCKKGIASDVVVKALDKSWHEECFVCERCKNPFTTGSFFTRDDGPRKGGKKAYCEDCYKIRLRSEL